MNESDSTSTADAQRADAGYLNCGARIESRKRRAEGRDQGYRVDRRD